MIANVRFAMTCTAGREKILELNSQIHQKLLLCQDQILMNPSKGVIKTMLAQQTLYVYKSEFYQSLIKLWLLKVWVLSKFDQTLTFQSLSFIKVWLLKVWVLSKFDFWKSEFYQTLVQKSNFDKTQTLWIKLWQNSDFQKSNFDKLRLSKVKLW